MLVYISCIYIYIFRRYNDIGCLAFFIRAGQPDPRNAPPLRNKASHSRKLTWIPKLAIFERRYHFKTIILGIHVSFRGCNKAFVKGNPMETVGTAPSRAPTFRRDEVPGIQVSLTDISDWKMPHPKYPDPSKLAILKTFFLLFGGSNDP